MENTYIKKTWPKEYKTGEMHQFELTKCCINPDQLLELLILVINVTDLNKIIQEYLEETIKGDILCFLNIDEFMITHSATTVHCSYRRISNICSIIIIKYNNLELRAYYSNLISKMCNQINLYLCSDKKKEKIYDTIHIFDLLLKDLIKS